jgi:MoaA/NifB/PqqE/SkfB family radical SAM enzyme
VEDLLRALPDSGAWRTAAVCAKIPSFRLFRAYGRPALMPLTAAFVVTDRCNSLCRTCNIGQRYIDDPSVAEGELTLEEYVALFRSIGQLEWVTFSGGEPFMRPDFPEIVASLAEIVRPRVINVPTNATLVRATTQGVRTILERLGSSELIVNFSVDGVGAGHDDVRGFPGNFALFERCVDGLRKLGDPRLVIGVNTVLSRFNVADAAGIFDYVLERVAPASYVVEVAQNRPEYYNQGASLAPAPAETSRAIDLFLAKLSALEQRGTPRLVRAFRRKYYADVKRELVEPRGHLCFSAFASCAVMPHGEVWSNTQRADLLGNVRDYGLDFPALWFSPEADRVRDKIRHARCYCETSNVAYTNALMDLHELPKVFYHYVRDA